MRTPADDRVPVEASGAAPKSIPIVVQQHAEESAILRHVRSVLVRAPHVKLHQLRRFDDRIAAHLDGLAVAGEDGWRRCEAALENPGAGEVFTAAVRAIEEKNSTRLDRLFALTQGLPEAQRGLVSAFGWVSASQLGGTAANLLSAADSLRRCVAIAACEMHGVDPRESLARAMREPEATIRARGLRAAGVLGRRDLLGACTHALQDADIDARYWAAHSSLLLGDRGGAIEVLQSFAAGSDAFRRPALGLLLRVLDLGSAQRILKRVSRDPGSQRALIEGAGIAGDPQYVPWLIKQMESPEHSRLAGESFAFITGLDLAYVDLERRSPEGVEFGPNEDPNDENVAMDADESLPWPDSEKIQKWWEANRQRFQPGIRYFMGEPVTREHCLDVLKEGYQRQRIAAAQYLCLLAPGTLLFQTRAPAWRQKRWLAKLA